MAFAGRMVDAVKAKIDVSDVDRASRRFTSLVIDRLDGTLGCCLWLVKQSPMLREASTMETTMGFMISSDKVSPRFVGNNK